MKINKSLVLGIIIGTIITGTISVGAATYFSAEQIKFTPTNAEWEVDNAQDAMNDLFNNQTNTIKNLSTDVTNGKSLLATAITNKGISTSSDSTFETMATNIGKLNVNSTSSSSITGYVFANAGAYIYIGMENYTNASISLGGSDNGKGWYVNTSSGGTFGTAGSYIRYQFAGDGRGTYTVTLTKK